MSGLLKSTMTQNKFYRGQLVFDRKRSDLTDALMLVVDPAPGIVDDQDEETRRLILGNEDNKKFGVTRETECVSTVFIEGGQSTDPHLSEKIYTYPVTRVATVETRDDSALAGFHPYQWALAAFLSSMFEVAYRGVGDLTVEQLQVICMEADIDGEIIRHAARMADSSKPHEKVTP